MNVVVQRFINTSLRGFASLSIKNQLNPLNSGHKPIFAKAFRNTGIWKEYHQRKMTTNTAAIGKPKIVFVLGTYNKQHQQILTIELPNFNSFQFLKKKK